MKQKLFMIIQYCAILKTFTTNSTDRSGLVVVSFVSLFPPLPGGFKPNLNLGWTTIQTIWKSPQAKVLWASSGKKSFSQTSTKWRMQERSSAREAGSILVKMVILDAQVEWNLPLSYQCYSTRHSNGETSSRLNSGKTKTHKKIKLLIWIHILFLRLTSFNWQVGTVTSFAHRAMENVRISVMFLAAIRSSW